MSRDAQYIIRYEGPFGEKEMEENIAYLNAIPSSYGFDVWGYETVIGETKHGPDDEVIVAAQKGTALQVLRRYDDDYFEEIYRYGNPPATPTPGITKTNHE